MEADEPASAPADAPANPVVAAIQELKRVVDAAAEVAPSSLAASSTSALLKLPVLAELKGCDPAAIDAVAAELLAAGSHIRLLSANDKRQKKKIEELTAQIKLLRKDAGNGDANGDGSLPAIMGQSLALAAEQGQ